MADWMKPRRYLLIFTQRGGSTFLAHCLDSHYQIGWERGEPLHPAHQWWGAFAHLRPPERSQEILKVLLDRPGYYVTGARVNYRHWRLIPLKYLEGLDGILHLHRHNAFRVVLSSIINRLGLRTPHTYEPLDPLRLEVDPELLIREISRYVGNVKGTRKALMRLGPPVLALRYDEMVGGEGVEAELLQPNTERRVCEFLGVRQVTMGCHLKRTNPEPAATLIKNWREVRQAIINADFGEYLDDEAA